MNIGFVSTWFERGGAYVTKAYVSLFQDDNVYIYARGGYRPKSKTDKSWNASNVTYGYKMNGTDISKNHIFKWIRKCNVEILFFNEQMEFRIIAEIRKNFPQIKLGTYIDYYTQSMVPGFELYDFLICNTKRHQSVFEWHPQSYYVPWGTDVNVFKPQKRNYDKVTFFHSAGMSLRKGTKELIEVFISSDLCKESKLVLHTQIPVSTFTSLSLSELESHNITVIEKTVTAPGLYHMGDVYVYPTTLDGLGLTMYEALSCGLPVIATDCAPMNEIISNERGRLIKVDKYIARADGYYWPLSLISKESLYEQMKYYVDHREFMLNQQEHVRKYALENIDWQKRREEIKSIFITSRKIKVEERTLERYIDEERKHAYGRLYNSIVGVLPGVVQNFCHEKIR